MIVIARVKELNKEVLTSDKAASLNMKVGTPCYSASIEKIEHMIGLEDEQIEFTDYACKWFDIN